MFVATLIANPKRANLDREAVEALRNAWGGGDAVWLTPEMAAEFALRDDAGQPLGGLGRACRRWASIWWCSPPRAAASGC